MTTITDITWKEHHTPYSEQYDDIYYPRGEGLEAARYVFLQQNNIAGLFAEKSEVTIAELGFGTGLNFFAALHLLRSSSSSARLIFHTFEMHPLSPELIEQASLEWPELGDVVREFLSHWPGALKLGDNGLIALKMAEAELVVHHGDASLCLKKAQFKADAWFLDGFKPATNPAMWSAEAMQEVSRLSAPGATLSTWCSAGDVRRSLSDAGFIVERVKGYGRKRHSIRARLG